MTSMESLVKKAYLCPMSSPSFSYTVLLCACCIAVIEFLIEYKKRTEILLPNSKDIENTLVEIDGLIELLKNESTDQGIFLLEEAMRMFTSGRNMNTNSDIIARNEACLVQILEPQVPWLTLDYARDLS